MCKIVCIFFSSFKFNVRIMIIQKKMLTENCWNINGFQHHNKYIHEFEQKSEKTQLYFFNTQCTV